MKKDPAFIRGCRALKFQGVCRNRSVGNLCNVVFESSIGYKFCKKVGPFSSFGISTLYWTCSLSDCSSDVWLILSQRWKMPVESGPFTLAKLLVILLHLQTRLTRFYIALENPIVGTIFLRKKCLNSMQIHSELLFM